MGFLDRAKKLADQAREKAQEALAEAKSKAETFSASRPSSSPSASTSTATAAGERDPRWGTAYVPGMLGRPGWREQGLTDPAGVLPVAAREQVGVRHSTKSEVREELFGMGRRWTAEDGRSVGLYYEVHPDHRAWAPPEGRSSYEAVPGAAAAVLNDGRTLVFLGGGDHPVVLETDGLDPAQTASLARTVAGNLP